MGCKNSRLNCAICRNDTVSSLVVGTGMVWIVRVLLGSMLTPVLLYTLPNHAISGWPKTHLSRRRVKPSWSSLFRTLARRSSCCLPLPWTTMSSCICTMPSRPVSRARRVLLHSAEAMLTPEASRLNLYRPHGARNVKIFLLFSLTSH